MSNTNIASDWVAGNLIFSAKVANSSIQYGEGTTNLDAYWYGSASTNYMLWDASANKLSFAGDVDFGLLGSAAANTLTWDAGTNKLSLIGASTMQVGESTTGVTTAGGTSLIYGYGYHKTNALTGNLRGVRGNAVVHVASVAGTAEGVFGRGANGKATTDVDGVNLLTAIGGSFLVAGVGLAATGSTITNAYGVYSQLDINAANLTVTNARGIYVNVQAQASGSTITNCDLAYLEYESVAGTAAQIRSAVKVGCVGGTGGIGCLIDASTAPLNVFSGNVVVLFKFQDKAGTVNYVIHDTDAATVLAVTTSAPTS
jgi:hypothetical protein